MNETGGQFHIAAKNKFTSVQELMAYYHSNPIRSKQRQDQTILLARPIPVDPVLEAEAMRIREEAKNEAKNEPAQGESLS